jgi:dCTP deaminase
VDNSEREHSLLSRPAILRHLGDGVIIDPFSADLLNNCSYDVRIGPWFFRTNNPDTTGDLIFNPYDSDMISRYYGDPLEAPLAANLPQYEEGSRMWRGIAPDNRVIMMKPDEIILAHTMEYVGGAKDLKSGRCFNAEMKARSSVGRLGFEVCRCAGWGDIGYVNRWTMEVTCTAETSMPLAVGTPVAQMKFYEVETVEGEFLYGTSTVRDGYQTSVDIEEIKRTWNPRMLLPRALKIK